ncbi:hypothetical protein TNCV_1923291 [Trichonephila clavipes]|nr:hypothetical protein TNCV_1923291 [Trichonephila clavipes]
MPSTSSFISAGLRPKARLYRGEALIFSVTPLKQTLESETKHERTCALVSVKTKNEMCASYRQGQYPRKSLESAVLTATAGSDVVQSGRSIFDDFFQHLWPYIGNNTANVVFQRVKRLWLIRIDQ